MYVTNTGSIGIFLIGNRENAVLFLKNVEMALDKATAPLAGITKIEYRGSWKK